MIQGFFFLHSFDQGSSNNIHHKKIGEVRNILIEKSKQKKKRSCTRMASSVPTVCPNGR